MELTECICGKIEEMRQKKLARYQAASAKTEKLIARLTSRRSSLFDALENEMQKHQNTTISLASEVKPVRAGRQSIIKKALEPENPAEDAYDVTDSKKTHQFLDERLGSAHDVDDDDDEEDNEHHVAENKEDAFPTVYHREHEEQDSETGITKLREEAAETDDKLQEERAYIQALRSSLASNLARLDELENDICKHSTRWEREEKERLSIDQASLATPSPKRKRGSQAETSESQQRTKRVMRRAVETLVVLSLGAGIAVAKQAYL